MNRPIQDRMLAIFLAEQEKPAHCMYCGRDDCGHALMWQSRAWSSECAAKQPVSPLIVGCFESYVRDRWQRNIGAA